MGDERVDMSVLIVDDDEISLAILTNILIAWKIKVLTSKGARDALNILREFEGFFDLVISEFHVLGMSGFEFQKRVKDEFQLPIIMMSADNRNNVISKSMEYGAADYILKPFCADDFKNIWKYVEERKKKAILEDVSSNGTSSLISSEPKSKKQYYKRKNRSENQSGDEGRVVLMKKSKMIWTTYLHNLFMHAIKQLGMDKAVPKKILAIMNVPGLTRENVASHLQKYRIFLRKIIQTGLVDGLSHRALRSKFASGIPISVIEGIQSKFEKEFIKPNNINQVPTLPLVNQLGRVDHQPLPYLLQNQHANPLINQPRLGQSSFGNNNNNGIMKNMFGSYPNPSYDQGGSYGLMSTCANPNLYQNYNGSMGNHNYSNDGLGNWNKKCLMSSSTSNILPQPQVNYFGVQLSDVLKIVEKERFNNVGTNAATTKINSFVFQNGTQRFGFDDFGSNANANANAGNVNGLPTSLITTGNNNNSTTSTIEGNMKQMENDSSELFFVLNNMNLLNEMDESNYLISETMNSEFITSNQVVQRLEQPPLQQSGKTSNVVFSSTEPLTDSSEDSNKNGGDDEFQNGELYDLLMGDNVASTSTTSSTITDQDNWDIDLIEAFLGAQEN